MHFLREVVGYSMMDYKYNTFIREDSEIVGIS
jgi:hypothetical protein